MHINMKYYIVSIGAIFISLGIGILVGYNLNYDQELSKQQAGIIQDLDKQFNTLKETNDTLEKNLEAVKGDYDKAIDFINENVDSLVINRLENKSIGIISTNQDNNYTSEIEDIITKASGNVAFDIVLRNNIYDEKKLEELSSKLNQEFKSTKDVMIYIENALSENNANEKLKNLETLEIITINKLNDNYQNYDSVVLAGGNNGKSGKEQYEKIDKVLIDTLKDKEKNIVGVQQSNAKFSYVDLYSENKISTVDNVEEGIGKLSLVMLLQDSSVAGKFGILEESEDILPYKK
ncbi:copper transporter [Romboutsia sp. 13368]|uniref:copper transporter n=1 Tax=Romboutsia sp. 13368 TaxID=2708053 RepID=UPI0025F2A394|nr:copper transporter [Romboutsia sp. 13368]